jgi:mannose-1-phosphate guanylyltransferase
MDGVVGMVLAAGFGTRLRPLTDRLPKPAVPVAGLPLLQFALARMRAAGATRAVVNAHHLPGEMERVALEAGRGAGVQVAISHEPVLAGTGGALREARSWLRDAHAVVLWNGDVLFDLDLAAVVAAHRESGALATMVLAPMPPGASYATVDVDRSMAVRRIAGHGPGGADLVPLHFTGVHVLSPALLDRVPGAPFACDVNRQVYPPWLEQGQVRAVVAGGYWNDLGTPGRYLQANLDVLSGAAPVALPGAEPFAALREVAPGVWAEAGADVDPRATLLGPAFIGSGCVIPAGSRVERAVLWPGTVLRPGERVVDAVAAGELRVPSTG